MWLVWKEQAVVCSSRGWRAVDAAAPTAALLVLVLVLLVLRLLDAPGRGDLLAPVLDVLLLLLLLLLKEELRSVTMTRCGASGAVEKREGLVALGASVRRSVMGLGDTRSLITVSI